MVLLLFFFFQAEDGIRDATVTGVQTCALPIFGGVPCTPPGSLHSARTSLLAPFRSLTSIGGVPPASAKAPAGRRSFGEGGCTPPGSLHSALGAVAAERRRAARTSLLAPFRSLTSVGLEASTVHRRSCGASTSALRATVDKSGGQSSLASPNAGLPAE